MGNPKNQDEPAVHTDTSGRPHGNVAIFGLVALALVLAIGFFYLTSERRDERQVDDLTKAAKTIDDAARVVGKAAKNAADALRDGH